MEGEACVRREGRNTKQFVFFSWTFHLQPPPTIGGVVGSRDIETVEGRLQVVKNLQTMGFGWNLTGCADERMCRGICCISPELSQVGRLALNFIKWKALKCKFSPFDLKTQVEG